MSFFFDVLMMVCNGLVVGFGRFLVVFVSVKLLWLGFFLFLVGFLLGLFVWVCVLVSEDLNIVESSESRRRVRVGFLGVCILVGFFWGVWGVGESVGRLILLCDFYRG